MDMWKKEALPCPFCGGMDLEMKENKKWLQWQEEYFVQVACKSCGAAGPNKKFVHHDFLKRPIAPHDCYEMAVIEWNKAKR